MCDLRTSLASYKNSDQDLNSPIVPYLNVLKTVFTDLNKYGKKVNLSPDPGLCYTARNYSYVIYGI